jgi:hypothetical protein
MNRFFVFVIRVILGGIFGVILIRLFYPQAGILWIICAAAALVGLAYITEYFRMKRRDGH